MAATHFTTAITVNRPASAVFNAINNVHGWWQGKIEGSTGKPGDEFTYRMRDLHFSKQKVVELIADKKVVWLVTDSQLSFVQDQQEWTGSKIVFEITEKDGHTEMIFTHEGLLPDCACYDACSNGWTGLIQNSLYNLITEGKGVRVFE